MFEVHRTSNQYMHFIGYLFIFSLFILTVCYFYLAKIIIFFNYITGFSKYWSLINLRLLGVQRINPIPAFVYHVFISLNTSIEWDRKVFLICSKSSFQRALKQNWTSGKSYLHVRTLISRRSINCLFPIFWGCTIIIRIFLFLVSSKERKLASLWASSLPLLVRGLESFIVFCHCSPPINFEWRLQVAHPRTREFLLITTRLFAKTNCK